MIPSLRARNNRRIKLERFLISPYDHCYRDVTTMTICWLMNCVSVCDEQMSAHDNHFTYSSGMLSSLGARRNHRIKLGDFLFLLMIVVIGM